MNENRRSIGAPVLLISEKTELISDAIKARELSR